MYVLFCFHFTLKTTSKTSHCHHLDLLLTSQQPAAGFPQMSCAARDFFSSALVLFLICGQGIKEEAEKGLSGLERSRELHQRRVSDESSQERASVTQSMFAYPLPKGVVRVLKIPLAQFDLLVSN